MNYLQEIRQEISQGQQHQYPFSVAATKISGPLRFATPVTFFVGENGSGKSTILEALAAAIDLPTIGGDSIRYDDTLVYARQLAKCMRLTWNQKSQRGFFLRSEDFFNFSRRMANMARELAEDAAYYEESLSGYGLQLAKGSALAQRDAIVRKYGENLDANSHGEAVMHLLLQRIVPEGLYLMDEPETPFSPSRQLALLSLIKQTSEREGCQFVIATHSPILLALPDATIYSFDHSPLSTVGFEDLEHVNLTRDFLNNPGAFLRHL
ncbi:MAG: AAA family ATPase [Limnochordia bacterium]|jgi:predicted ATPase|nr:AAA family ATPase [Limnochordia bacterium]MDD4517398.1 AAA family ATPase [Limnochordia bacterium]